MSVTNNNVITNSKIQASEASEKTLLNYGMYFLIYAIVLITTVLFFVYSDNSKSFSYNTLGFVMLTIIILSVAVFYYYPKLKNKNMNSGMVYLMAGLIMFISVFSYVGLTIDQKNLKNLGIVALVIFLLIVIVGLAVFFYIFGDYLKQRRGLLGLIINFIFFIPCLVIDLVEFTKRELFLTTRTEYILLFIEVLLILCYFYAAPLLNSALSSGTVYILKSPVYLNKQTDLLKGTKSLATEKNTNLLMQNADSSSEDKSYSSNFSLSMWVYLNVQTKNSIRENKKLFETEIFSYGEGKPKITYTNNIIDGKNRDSYNFYFTDKSDAPNFQISIPSQKWNNIVFNYSSNKVDLFINGILEKTFIFDDSNKIPVYADSDVIRCGQPNGLYGAICNIVYTKENLLNNQIVNNYNILMLKNPPLPQI
jgi:hypothetical protein